MLKADKERIVEELTERLKTTPTLFVADYRGLSVTEIDALLAMLEGPTAIAFIEADGDMVGVAKALSDTAKTTRILSIRGGILDGNPIGEADVQNLATLPPLEVLRGQVLGAITAPLMTVVGLISAPVRDLIGLIDARIEQLQAEGEPEGSVPAATAEESQSTEESAGSEEEPVAAESETEEPVVEASADTDSATDESATQQTSEEE
jgi:large subunit ribosomal protein L10